MTSTTLKVEVGRSLPTATVKIIAVNNKSPGSNGRVLTTKVGEAVEDRGEGVAKPARATMIATIKPAVVSTRKGVGPDK